MEGRDEPRERIDYEAIAASPEFRALAAARRRVTAGLLGIFTLALGTFLVLCGYARPFMRRSVDGGLTVAYVWLLALTVLAWILVMAYMRFASRRFEPAAAAIARGLGADPGEESEAPVRAPAVGGRS